MIMKLDIKTVCNSIGGRQGWAYICNSGEYAVLKADLRKPQKYDDYKVFDGVRVEVEDRHGKSFHDCTLEWSADSGWEFGQGGFCISSSFGLSDAIELIEHANNPVVRKNEVFALAIFGDKSAELKLFKITRTDRFCSTLARLVELNDEEMNEIVEKAKRWCNR